MLFLLSGVSSRVLAAEMTIASEASLPIAAADLRANSVDAPFVNHRFELGSADANGNWAAGDDAPTPLFASPSISATNPTGNPSASDWDYLWKSASRIPIASIPEPTTGSLLIGGAILLWRRRVLKTIK